MKTKARMFERTYPWGKALKLESLEAPGGLLGHVNRIRDAIGPTIGTRNTFAKLFELDAPPESEHDPIDALRARLLVDALGLDPVEWGVAEVALPTAYDPERVLVLVGGAAGRLVPGGVEDSGTSQKSRMRESRTLSNRTGSGRARRGGRAPVQPDFPGSMGAHRATEDEAA